jgi:hypothetical protein
MPTHIDEQSGVVTQLAALLCQASRLASQVNSDRFSDEQRRRLLDLVGSRDYLELAENINQMRSPSARESARLAGSLRGRRW